MARYLSTIPDNPGYYNLGNVWAYPTGGTGPTAYGATSYYGSDPLPEIPGDSLYNPVDLGDFTAPLRTLTISNTHGGLSRRQSSFYKISLYKPRAIQFTQNYSQFAYTSNTNRNTLLSFYKCERGVKPVELPINNLGYVYTSTSIEYDTTDDASSDFPNVQLPPGDYIFLITNDIRYSETTYSISIVAAVTDWRFVSEAVTDSLDFGRVTEGVDSVFDAGSLAP